MLWTRPLYFITSTTYATSMLLSLFFFCLMTSRYSHSMYGFFMFIQVTTDFNFKNLTNFFQSLICLVHLGLIIILVIYIRKGKSFGLFDSISTLLLILSLSGEVLVLFFKLTTIYCSYKLYRGCWDPYEMGISRRRESECCEAGQRDRCRSKSVSSGGSIGSGLFELAGCLLGLCAECD